MEGKIFVIMVESPSTKDKTRWIARTSGNKMVQVPNDDE